MRNKPNVNSLKEKNMPDIASDYENYRNLEKKCKPSKDVNLSQEDNIIKMKVRKIKEFKEQYK